MKCHYEILNISRDVENADIKTAYRKMALKWHPDKNLDDPGAKEQFQLIQQAYEVLSDHHERAWYDKHREQILRGGDKEYEDTSLDVFQYFTVSCYKGFDDNPKGFYSVYSEVFKTIATEDIEFMETEDEFDKIPTFGNSKSGYDDVVGPFYAYWQSYCTKKSYAWLCPHNINEIRDRRSMKLIEKENKKIQQKARKERNEEVRNLIAFVRKRDKRVQAYKIFLEEKAEINRCKQEKIRIEQILKRQNEIKEQGKCQIINEDYAVRIKQLEAAYAGSSEDEDSYSDNELDQTECKSVEETENLEFLDDDLYCVACNKLFKHQSSFKNHESSKKHKDNIEKLKQEMLLDEENYVNVLTSSSSSSSDNSDVDEDDENGKIKLVPNVKQKNKKGNKLKKKLTAVFDDVEDEKEKETIDLLSPVEENGTDDWMDDSKKKKKTRKPKSTSKLTITDEKQNPEIINEKIEQNKNEKKKNNKLKGKKNISNGHFNVEDNEDGDDSIPTIDINQICVTCHTKFDSKNKLFNHLKKEGHGVAISLAGTTDGEKKNIKKKKQK